ncbi:MAG: DNA gyrase subunit A [Bacilli bacterium]|nr:DNA gyrase subunit A [Bacilli bacterium]
MKDKLVDVNISNEMETSFLDYSMSVIVARALPDVRDGLKPVHRRIIYGMQELGVSGDKPHKKSARIVGDVMGKYHPHGDSSIYDAMVRMAQDFSYRYPLVDGHGNFGSLDGDGAAASRYTEARMSKITAEMIRDINKNTVDFMDNYTGEEKEPTVLPSRFPNLLVNGSTGIAVGMATNIPPHNLGEVIDGCVAYIDNHEISNFELMSYIKGPDFPTGASILGNSGIKKAYETGRGIITVRGKAFIEDHNNHQRIVITEIPYQINKANLVSKIAELVRDKVIDGISDLRDESNYEGIRVVVELKKDANANVILNNLYKNTSLQTGYGIILLALVDGQPKVLQLKQIIEKYIDHQREVIYRRTKFDLDKAQNRAHILEGLKIALDHIDEIIKILKSSNNDEIAKNTMIERFGLSIIQAEAILEMKLRRLTGLEREKIEDELKELLQLIENLIKILASEEKVLEIVKQELIEIKNKYNDERRTLIDTVSIDYIEDESLIPVEDVIITLTNKGYIKRIPTDTYKLQNKGGVGVKGITTNEEDVVQNLITLTTHDYILFFTNKGKVYRVKGYEVPEFSRQAKGLPIVNLLPIEKDEVVNSMLSISIDDKKSNLIFATKLGLVKRVDLTEFENIRKSGKIAITLKDDDELIGVRKTNGSSEIMLASSSGRMVRFEESEVRVMGRTASGVKGINLGLSFCVGVEIAEQDKEVLVVTENGYGKRTKIEEYRITHRGSKGVKTLNSTEKNGNIISFKIVDETEDLIIITDNGMLIKIPISQISIMSRVTQGVRLITLKDEQKVATTFNVAKEEVPESDTASIDQETTEDKEESVE